MKNDAHRGVSPFLLRVATWIRFMGIAFKSKLDALLNFPWSFFICILLDFFPGRIWLDNNLLPVNFTAPGTNLHFCDHGWPENSFDMWPTLGPQNYPTPHNLCILAPPLYKLLSRVCTSLLKQLNGGCSYFYIKAPCWTIFFFFFITKKSSKIIYRKNATCSCINRLIR